MLIDINPDSTAPGNNPNNPDCLCDVNSREGCKCSGEHNSQNIDKWVITIEHHINDNSNKENAIETLIEAFSTILKKLK